jgi:hypothetical protein
MLTDERRFAEALQRLARAHGRELDSAAMRAYWEILRDRLDDDTFERACEVLLSGEWWPTPARILRAAELVTAFERQVAFQELYDAIRACDEAGPTGGTVYRLSTIRARCGDLAAELVQAVGGPAAFEATLRREQEEPFLRRAFMEAAADLYRSRPAEVRQLVGQLVERSRARQRLSASSRPALGPSQRALPAGPQAEGV